MAHRSHASQEFNYGLVMSAQPLQDNQIFEVRTLCQCYTIFILQSFNPSWDAIVSGQGISVGSFRVLKVRVQMERKFLNEGAFQKSSVPKET